MDKKEEKGVLVYRCVGGGSYKHTNVNIPAAVVVESCVSLTAFTTPLI